jgi:YHS domain-containing protein
MRAKLLTRSSITLRLGNCRDPSLRFGVQKKPFAIASCFAVFQAILLRIPGIHLREGENPMPIDPVCKMEVSIADAAASHDYHAETLYFCSIDCLRKFESDPAVYMDDMSDEERIA